MEKLMIEEKNGWKKNTVLFMLSQAITLLGSSVVQMAIIWQVALVTSSGIWVTLLTLSATIPQALLSLLGGAWADRYSKKKMIVYADLLIAGVTLGLVLVLAIGVGPAFLPLLLVVAAARSFAAGIQGPAVNAVIPLLVPEKHLLRYNGINGSAQSIIQFAAPALAGAMLALSSFQWVLMLDVFTAIIGIGLLFFVKITQTASEHPGQEPLVTAMKIGLTFVRQTRPVRSVLLLFGAFIFFTVPSGFLSVLLIRRTFGDSYFYLTVNEMVGFSGMVLGGLLLGAWGGFKSRRKTLAFGMTIYGLFSCFLSVTSQFWLFAGLMFFVSFAIPFVQSAVTTELQETVPPDKQGRVFGLFGMIYNTCMPLGMAVFGPLADFLEIQWLIAPCGIILICLGILSVSKSALRES